MNEQPEQTAITPVLIEPVWYAVRCPYPDCGAPFESPDGGTGWLRLDLAEHETVQ